MSTLNSSACGAPRPDQWPPAQAQLLGRRARNRACSPLLFFSSGSAFSMGCTILASTDFSPRLLLMQRVPYPELLETLRGVLLKLGFEAARAELCARLFAETTRDGVYSHGVNRVPRFVR